MREKGNRKSGIQTRDGRTRDGLDPHIKPLDLRSSRPASRLKPSARFDSYWLQAAYAHVGAYALAMEDARTILKYENTPAHRLRLKSMQATTTP